MRELDNLRATGFDLGLAADRIEQGHVDLALSYLKQCKRHLAELIEELTETPENFAR
jgi:hypothetical protein